MHASPWDALRVAVLALSLAWMVHRQQQNRQSSTFNFGAKQELVDMQYADERPGPEQSRDAALAAI